MASKRALLVAINDYGNQQNNLPSCLEDAHRFRSLLEERYGFDQFKELHDGDATVAKVEKGLTWLFEDVAPDDRLVFFYSGHGYQQPKGENRQASARPAPRTAARTRIASGGKPRLCRDLRQGAL